jgi:hypothetical protein
MKKLLLTVALAVAAFVGVNAQTVYNISEIYAAGDAVESKGGLIVRDATGKAGIDSNSKTFADVKYTVRYKTGAKGGQIDDFDGPTSGALGFPVSGPGTVTVAVLSASSSSNRAIGYSYVPTDENAERVQGSTGMTANASVTDLQSFEFTGKEPGTLFLYSTEGGGINFYMITYTPASTTALNGIAADQEVVATEYYNINGMRVDAATPGIYVKKQVLADGSQKVSKAVVR